jgi:LuxR family transcriptional regulator, quorum-sensing system regulator SolR
MDWETATLEYGGDEDTPSIQPHAAANRASMEQCPHAAHCRNGLLRAAPATPEMLTEREREIMRWTAEGKTAFEVGLIVGLTERAVNFHIGRVLVKLGATNKTHAAVMAAVMGIL